MERIIDKLYMAFFSCVISATILWGLYICFEGIKTELQETNKRLDMITEMLKRDIEFSLIDEQSEIDKIIFTQALDYKTTCGEPMQK